MGDAIDPDTLTAESQRLLVQFLDRELELTETLMELTRLELRHGSSPHAEQTVIHVRQGLDTIHKFLGRVPRQEDQARIKEKLDRLEAEACGLSQPPPPPDIT